jgi:hypothetical protein
VILYYRNQETKIKEIKTLENYISRPEWNNAIKGRSLVWYWRYCSAWDLASILEGEKVTEEEYNEALKLLDSVQRYALADASEWEKENSSEWYCNSTYHKERERQLDARRERLQKRLSRYGLKMVNYGLYPTIVDQDNNAKHMLHYFD